MQTYTIPQGTKELTIETYNDKIVIEFVPEKKKPIFTTEDGVNLYGKQDECWYVRLCDNGVWKQPFVHEAMDSHSGFKYFSSQQAARQYAAEKKWEPKDGEVIATNDNEPIKGIIIYKYMSDKCAHYYSLLDLSPTKLFDATTLDNKDYGLYFGMLSSFRPATPSEAQLLFDKLAEAGYRWDAEEKKVEKVRWRAKKGENYWTITANGILYTTDFYSLGDNTLHNSGFYFRTSTQAEAAFEAVKNLLLNTEF